VGDCGIVRAQCSEGNQSAVQRAYRLDELPEPCRRLFETATGSFYTTLPWFEVLARTAFADAGEALVQVAGGEEAPEAALVLLARRQGWKGLRARELQALANYYSCLYEPVLLRPGDPAGLEGLVDGIAAARPRWDVVHLTTLAREEAGFARLQDVFARRGWSTFPYFQFGNWYEATGGLSLEGYLERRPKELRNTLRRKGAKLERSGLGTYRLFLSGDDIEEGITAYETIYAQSWKRSEPHPAFTPALIRTAARLGALRLGVLYIGGEPAAAQLWLVWRGKATIFKLAHDARFDSHSAGSLLSLWMVRHALEVDRVEEIDLGRGDDPYKASWLSQRRERWGLIACNRATPAGLGLAALHSTTGLLSALRRRLRR